MADDRRYALHLSANDARALPDSLLAPLSSPLAERIGLHFPAERWEDLERGITAAVPAFGMTDTDSCVQRLLSMPALVSNAPCCISRYFP